MGRVYMAAGLKLWTRIYIGMRITQFVIPIYYNVLPISEVQVQEIYKTLLINV